MVWQEMLVHGLYWGTYLFLKLPQIILVVFTFWVLVKLLGVVLRSLGVLGGWSLSAFHFSKHLFVPVIWMGQRTKLFARFPWIPKLIKEFIWLGYPRAMREEAEREWEQEEQQQRQREEFYREAFGDGEDPRYERRKRERQRRSDTHTEPPPHEEYGRQDFHEDSNTDFGFDPFEEQAPPPPPREDSPWEILGVEPGASKAEIRKAYMVKVKQYHPDRVNDLGPELQDLATKKLKDINRAWEQLK